MGANFANFGLVSQGMDASQADTQNRTLTQQRIAQGDQATQLGQMGLEEAQRERTTRNTVRAAGANVAASGGTMSGSLLAMADAAAKAGDVQSALQYRQVNQQLEDAGAKNLVHAALVDPTPGDRPDIVKVMRQTEGGRDVTRASLDDKGNLTVVKTDGQPRIVNVGKMAVALGMVKPYQEKLNAGDTLVTGMPGQGPSNVYTAPPAQRYQATSKGSIFSVTDGKVSYTPPDEDWSLGEVMNGSNKVPVSFNKKTGEAVVLGPGGNQQDAKVHTDNTGATWVTIGQQVFKVNPGSPGSPGSSGFMGIGGTPATPATGSSLEPVTPPTAASAPDAKQAPDGNWYKPDGKGGWLRAVAPGSPAATPVKTPRPANVPAEDEEAWRGVSEANAKRQKASAQGRSVAPASMRPEKVDTTIYVRTKNPRGGYTYSPAPKIARAGGLTAQGKTMAEWAALDSGERVANKADGGKVTRYGL